MVTVNFNERYRSTRAKTYHLFHRQPIWVKQPRMIQFDTQNRCSLQCYYCNPQGSFTKSYGYGVLPLETMEYVLKYVKDKRWWIDYVAPFMNGDPLLEPRLPVIAKMIKKYLNAKVNVFTNAALYENRHLLRDRNIDIVHCTVSAATRETYRQVHGRDCFNDAVKTVRWLSKKKRLNQYIIMVYVLNSRNFHELEQWKSLFRGFKQIVRPLFDAGDVKPQSKQAEGNRAFEEYLAKASQTVFPSNLQYSNRPCPCWESLNISYKGELMQCMDLPYELNGGSVFDVDIEEFWLDRNRRGLDCDGCRECKMKNPNWRNLFRRCFNIQ